MLRIILCQLLIYRTNTPPVSPGPIEKQKTGRTLSTVLRSMIRGMSDPEKLPSEDENVFRPLVEVSEETNINDDIEADNKGSGSSSSPGKKLIRPKKMMSVECETVNHVRIKLL